MSQPVVEQLPAYLGTAREWIASAEVEGNDQFTAANLEEDQRQQLAAIAEERGLDSDLVIRWTAHLLRARHDEADPFHLIAQPQPADALRERFARGREEARQALDDLAATIGPEGIANYELIVAIDQSPLNLAGSGDGQHVFRQDGVSFGIEPLAAGDLLLSDNPESPIADIVQHPVVHRDPVWNNLTYASGTIDDPGRLDGWERGGRSLRTRTFEITAGKLYIYMRGGCRTYVEVDSHTINNGPLHGSLMREFPLPENDPEGRELALGRTRCHSLSGTSGAFADRSPRNRAVGNRRRGAE